jgi:heme-degrading monooxygenase HmoA
MCFTAMPGRADELADLFVQVASGLRSVPGCISWIVARNPQVADEVWIQELWVSSDAAEQALAAQDSGEGPQPADVMALCAGPPQRIDLTPVGGVGFS